MFIYYVPTFLILIIYSWINVILCVRIGRFRIPLDGSKYGKLETAVEAEKHGRAMDMCTINPLYLGQKYRYVYACGAKRPCNFPNALSKVSCIP